MRRNLPNGMAEKFAALLCAALLVLAPCAPSAAAESVPSRAECVAEAVSGRVLYERNADERLPMASTTKILTALIVIEDCDPLAVVTVPPSCAGVEGSSIYLKAGEKLTVGDLLKGLMLRSGNDCAEALALYHSGSIEKFAEAMNARAAALGAADSSFKNPHGLPAEGHYTTARDLARIACAAMQNERFRALVSAKSADLSDGGNGARHLVNKNKFLSMAEGANGVKTGYTKEAGRCLAAAAKRKGMQLVSVVLNSPDMYARSEQILSEAFEKYSEEKVFDASKIYTLPTDAEGKFCRCRAAEDFYYPLAEGEREKLRTDVLLPPRVLLPVFCGQELGEVRIFFENQLIFSQKIDSIDRVTKNWSDILGEIARRYVRVGVSCVSTNFLRNAASRAGAPAIN